MILMQENRSFDHAFGTLRGVRGFNDPRAVTLPDGNPVWRQTNVAGETYTPFHLDLKNTKATWLGSLPHSWSDQTDARNFGNHDRWLDTKASHHAGCAGMPLTLGYYDRGDIPFYYALADAFTICDQHFCSSLTGTTPNRLYLWTGTVRERQDAAAVPKVRNSEVDYRTMASWKTFPERLEENGVSWKIYQNELSWPTGLSKDEDAWLANFSDNPIEWFSQFHSGLLPTHLDYLVRSSKEVPAGEFAKLSPRAQSLHAKAFTTNTGDAAYRQLETLAYRDGDTPRELLVPKGDVLHQFRQDVETGKLPAVSWLVPPENFSDHPSAPWYGAWYVAEALDILTKNPEVWKKTIFILTYDENDGYFDHVPPFVAPDPDRPETGKVSAGIDTGLDYLRLEDDAKRAHAKDARGGPVGLGYRVPMVIASPWSRGGFVCSEVFDHTSVLQLLERVMQRMATGKLEETNISSWRRAVCGNLTSAFRAAREESVAGIAFPKKDTFLEEVHRAQFKPMPANFEKLSALPKQEPGVRPSCALPYEIYADGAVSADGKLLELRLEAAGLAGVPFHVYTPGLYRGRADLRTRAYAAAAGTRVTDAWEMDGFADSVYSLRVCGPNGFLRELIGGALDPLLDVRCGYLRNGNIELQVLSRMGGNCHLQVKDHAYGSVDRSFTVAPGGMSKLVLSLRKSFSWYDFSINTPEHANYLRRYAGRVEIGRIGFSDPAMS